MADEMMRLDDFADDDTAETDLTTRQMEVLGYISDRIEHARMPPTRAEIARNFGWRSDNAAQEHVKALARKGCLVLIKDSSRGIMLPDRC